ncbi:1-aminocyclopropane-1-carboxylate deaminase/D-cysteine desulfhydrase [Robinsoniella peoriensis]|uniref:1-aminocyclopropane-1-carboxylate deaminase/D-cysteine desulfhydrase n=1 Tax=Robinsoniella peoriensis TaxID=180332 RepID=UPI003753E517
MEITPIMKCMIGIEGLDIYIKRDDLLPFSFGGNKARIAHEFYADMDNRGKNCMIGYGNARSNLSRALANINSYRGGDCHIISPADDDGKRILTNNSFMVHACGAYFHECSKQGVAETVEKVMQECEKDGMIPYYIYGDKYGNGNEAVPVRAYFKVYSEIMEQEKQLGIQFDYIFLATGTGMTQSGLLAGKEIAGRDNQKIVGISVARKTDEEIDVIQKYLDIFFEEKQILVKKNPEICILDEYLFGGYGKYTDGIKKTIRSMFVYNGIPLDPTYTGKGFYGMTEYLKMNDIKDVKVLFIHTGGIPLFFDNINLLK